MISLMEKGKEYLHNCLLNHDDCSIEWDVVVYDIFYYFQWWFGGQFVVQALDCVRQSPVWLVRFIDFLASLLKITLFVFFNSCVPILRRSSWNLCRFSCIININIYLSFARAKSTLIWSIKIFYITFLSPPQSYTAYSANFGKCRPTSGLYWTDLQGLYYLYLIFITMSLSLFLTLAWWLPWSAVLIYQQARYQVQRHLIANLNKASITFFSVDKYSFFETCSGVKFFFTLWFLICILLGIRMILVEILMDNILNQKWITFSLGGLTSFSLMFFSLASLDVHYPIFRNV